jgi:hypothetical protein
LHFASPQQIANPNENDYWLHILAIDGAGSSAKLDLLVRILAGEGALGQEDIWPTPPIHSRHLAENLGPTEIFHLKAERTNWEGWKREKLAF